MVDNEQVLTQLHLACARTLARALAAEQRNGQPSREIVNRISAARGFTASAVQLTYAALQHPHGEMCSLSGCHEATDQAVAVQTSCDLIDWAELLLGGLGPAVSYSVSDDVIATLRTFDPNKERGARATITDSLPAMEAMAANGDFQPKGERGLKFLRAYLPLVKRGDTDLSEAALEALETA